MISTPLAVLFIRPSFSDDCSANVAYYIEHWIHICLLGLFMSGRSCQVPAFALFSFSGKMSVRLPYEPRPLEADGHKVGLHCRFEISILAKCAPARKGGSGREVNSP